jgi:hypothetical protein
MKAEKSALFARDWRNGRLAHTDLKLALEDRAEPLRGVSRHDVEQMLGAIALQSLAYYLKSAVVTEDCEREKLLAGC